MAEYSFPERNKFKARESVEPTFDIKDHNGLYVDLTEVRGSEMFDELDYFLGIDNNKLATPNGDFGMKIIFSGHLGCGKTVELRRFHERMHHPDRYFSIFILLQDEVHLQKFEPEDFYVLLIVRFMDALEKAGIKLDKSGLEKVITDWLSEEDVEKELSDLYHVNLEAEASIGAGFWNFIKVSNSIKSLFSSQSKTIRTVRQKVRNNPMNLIRKFNEAIDSARSEMRRTNPQRDFLFIIDDTEKTKKATHEKIFEEDINLISSIAANLICTVPIDYQLREALRYERYEWLVLPMIKLDDQKDKAIKKLREIITRRISEPTFFTEGALDYCVKMSGGCPRQLIKIVHRAMMLSKGQRIDMDTAKQATIKLGRDMFDRLTTKHTERLKAGDFISGRGDEVVRELLVYLCLLKYNGVIKINPLLKRFINTDE